MNRRFFIKSAMAGVIAASPLMQFAKAAPSNILKGYQSPPDAGFARKSMRLVAGDVPKGFRGTYFLNGPAKHERGGERYEHWFDGDGMVHAFRFGDEGATHEGRFVETPKFVEEREAGRFLYPTFGTIPENPKPALSSDTINAANISVLPVGDQIWALWEGGSPTALRPDDLSTEGFVTLGEGLTGVPVSAHPRVDTDGVIWSFGNAAMTGQLLLYKIMPDGSLAKFKVLNDLPHSMVHDFTMSERFLIVGFAPFLAENHEGAYLDRFNWHGDQARQYVVIDKENFEIVRRYELPAGFVFHHSPAWEEKDGTIRFGACTYKNADIMLVDTRAIMQGDVYAGNNHAVFETVTLYPDGRAVATSDGGAAEFPVADPRLAGKPATSFHIGRQTSENHLSNTLFARNKAGEVTVSWAASADTQMGEHVAAPKADGGVWLIGTEFDAARGRTLVSLFDGDALSSGPRAVWEAPQTLPVPLHGTWVGA